MRATGLILLGVLLLSVWWYRTRVRPLLLASGRDHWGGGLHPIDGLNRLFCERFHRFRFDPVALPEQSGAVLVSNHVSGLDPLLLAAAVERPLRFVIAREQYQRFGLQWFFRLIHCIPVDRGGRPERAFREALQALRDGDVVVVFPHGKIHLDTDPPRPLKGGAVLLAQLAQAPLVPVHLEGIRGQGHILPALWKRSEARLTAFPAMHCESMPRTACLQALDRLLSGSRGEN